MNTSIQHLLKAYSPKGIHKLESSGPASLSKNLEYISSPRVKDWVEKTKISHADQEFRERANYWCGYADACRSIRKTLTSRQNSNAFSDAAEELLRVYQDIDLALRATQH